MAKKNTAVVAVAAENKIVLKNTVHCEPVDAEFTYGGTTYQIKITPFVPLDMFEAMVSQIVNEVVLSGSYDTRYEYIKRRAIVETYSNVALPQNSNDAYEILAMSDLYNVVTNVVDVKDVYELDYVARTAIADERATQKNALLAAVQDAADKVDKITEAMEPIMNSGAVANVLSQLGNMQFGEKDFLEAILNK